MTGALDYLKLVFYTSLQTSDDEFIFLLLVEVAVDVAAATAPGFIPAVDVTFDELRARGVVFAVGLALAAYFLTPRSCGCCFDSIRLLCFILSMLFDKATLLSYNALVCFFACCGNKLVKGAICAFVCAKVIGVDLS